MTMIPWPTAPLQVRSVLSREAMLPWSQAMETQGGNKIKNKNKYQDHDLHPVLPSQDTTATSFAVLPTRRPHKIPHFTDRETKLRWHWGESERNPSGHAHSVIWGNLADTRTHQQTDVNLNEPPAPLQHHWFWSLLEQWKKDQTTTGKGISGGWLSKTLLLLFSPLLQDDLTWLWAAAKLSLTSLEGGLLKTAALEVSEPRF